VRDHYSAYVIDKDWEIAGRKLDNQIMKVLMVALFQDGRQCQGKGKEKI
jgi:hypothetical protein